MVRRASSLQAIAGVFATDLRSWQLSLRRLAFLVRMKICLEAAAF
jgi:hypothetical protein